MKSCQTETYIFKEHDIVHELLSDIIPGGYIRYLAKQPFGVLLLTDEQIEIFSKLIKHGDLKLHLDATVCVVGKIGDHEEGVFYYAGVVEGLGKDDPPLPLAEFLTNRHTFPDICNFLMRIEYA